MPLYKCIVAIPADTSLPKDRILLSPWFNDHGLTTDPASIAGQVVDVFAGPTAWLKQSIEATCTVYQHTPGTPTFGPPVASVTRYPGTVRASNCPRDVALCLSFYAGTNVKRRRGRLYLPISIRTGAGTDIAFARPSASLRTEAAALGTALSAVGGADVDWVVHSTVDDASYKVTNVWVDDEWDTQRRRGLTATTRSALSVSG